MKKTFILLILTAFTLGCFSTRQLTQNRKLLSAQVDSLQQMGAFWETIGPWDDKGSEQIDSMLEIFPDMLEKVLLNPQITQFRLDTLAFFSEQSEDGRLAAFVYEEKMGGTYRPFFSLLQFQKPNDSLEVTYLESEIYVGRVYDLQAKNDETLYLVMGSGKGCTTCIFAEAFLIRITNQGLEYLFSDYGEFRYTEDSGFDYHEERQELNIRYYDMGCTDEVHAFPDSCLVEAQYFFNGETFIIKE